MEEASNKCKQVLSVIEKQPLDMNKVQHTLEEAKTAVDYLIEQTDMMLDQAYLTEQVIQYANRYRSKVPALAAELSRSEEHTSELQSRGHLVCRLLLEKKKI